MPKIELDLPPILVNFLDSEIEAGYYESREEAIKSIIEKHRDQSNK